MDSSTSLVPRPVRAIRVTRGGLEPSAIVRIFPTSLTGDVLSEIAIGNEAAHYQKKTENDQKKDH